MPPAKTPAARARRTARATTQKTGISRKEVERATQRFEKALTEANKALQSLGQDFGRGAQSTYKTLGKSLKTLQRDAEKTNRRMLKDLEKLAEAVTGGRAPQSSRTAATRTRRSASAKSGTTRTRSTAAKRTGSRSSK
ncbi:MAG: hypothetical protein JO206_14030 [Solirubrobacterales bacterium]|nr:hypothetical protein [Solirubrobacterales bacterium]MBV9474083.1 hypothetical protein [Solirubrobacterales bacterium]MBV9838113.1 hypothetical protein [Solirubrobacterales bacterium]